MKKGVIILIAIVVVLGIAGAGLANWLIGHNNQMVELEEGVKAQWGQVENVYQRRMDLIPNIVATVKGYAEHEQETFTAVIEARAKATQVTVDPAKLTDPAVVAQFQQAQEGLAGALGKLMMISERYPELKADTAFADLRVQLEGSENRISVERKRYNDLARDYNTYIKKFPASMLAGFFGFQSVTYFEAQAGAQQAPKVEF